jgi:transposase InsO family protein
MCKVLGVTLSGYYAWRQRPTSAREKANQELVERIREVHKESGGIYGSPRVYEELKDQVACSENRVARLMRLHGIRGRQTRRYRSTTKRNRAHRVAPNLLQRDFSAEEPNEKWVADITYIWTGEGWLYLAAVVDLYSRRVVGWAMSHRMTEELTLSALRMAVSQRQPAAGLMHHSDQGSQYTSDAYQALLTSHGMVASMNGVGSWYDNAPMESFIGTLKTEWVHHRAYPTRDEARTDVFAYIEGFYNRRRRHSALDYLSPEAFEALHTTTA